MYSGFNIGSVIKKVISVLVTIGLIADFIYCVVRMLDLFGLMAGAGDVAARSYLKSIFSLLLGGSAVAILLWWIGLVFAGFADIIDKLTTINQTLKQIAPYIVERREINTQQPQKAQSSSQAVNTPNKQQPMVRTVEPSYAMVQEPTDKQKILSQQEQDVWDCIFCGEQNPRNISTCRKCKMHGNLYDN